MRQRKRFFFVDRRQMDLKAPFFHQNTHRIPDPQHDPVPNRFFKYLSLTVAEVDKYKRRVKETVLKIYQGLAVFLH